ncbi:DMT family transporter [Nocardioides zeae]|uniref:DMT family transporter n=1 Tax=Nocardioides imazamoxiresistens TaxID=3231893 RepID=A0ABU3Q1W2_9ACTN|nr:DMT family transporter [Nocardioides zeae]MDT9595131.1 DMT family transporter [Nocardioides zeae]
MTTVTPDAPPSGARAGTTGAGLLLALVSASAFGLSGSFARGLLETGWTAGAAVTARIGLAALVLLVPALLAMRGRWALLIGRPRALGTVALYGVLAVAGAQLCYFYAVSYLQVGVALLLEYTAPVAVVVWMWLRHGQRPGPVTLAGAALAAFGLAMVLGVLSGVSLNVVGVLWGLGAMVGASAYFIISADGDNGLPGVVLAGGGLTVGAVVLGAAGLLGLLPMAASTSDVVFGELVVAWWVPVLGLGLVSAALAYVTGIAASRRLGSRLASFVALSEVVMALLFAWLLLDELPGPWQLLGGLLILAGVVVVKLGEGRVRAVRLGEPEAAETAQAGGTA